MDKHRFADYVVIVIQRKGDERGHDIPTITGGVLRGQCAKKDPVVLVSIGGCLRPEREGGGGGGLSVTLFVSPFAKNDHAISEQE
jgi:hypothetical protein